MSSSSSEHLRGIRALALCVCRHEGRVLVQDLADPSTGERFLRPFGGAIEFGERAADAVRREFREELDVGLLDVSLIGVLESLFDYDGRAGHEIVFVFDGRLDDPSLYERADIVGREAENTPVGGVWLPLAGIGSIGVPLYPTGLTELLARD
jgi:8-oxo-dGTP pyrophosphatase MutT (NUDIX family)